MVRRNGLGKAMGVTAAACVIAMTLSACGGNASKGEVDANGKPVVTIQVITNGNTVKMDQMNWWKDLEAACDCSIKWLTTQQSAWDQQKNAILAAGDVSDLSIGTYNSADFARNPVFEDLSDDLDKMPNAKAYLERDEDARKYVANLDGRIYNIPSNVSSRATALAGGQAMMINKTWLDKLGLEVPETWDEFKTVLQAFKTEDPNGNGKADEIPMMIRALPTNGFGWWDPFLLLNGTGIATEFTLPAGSKGIYVQDGKVKTFMVSDEFRSVIDYYHELIADGLIPSDALTKKDDAYYATLKGDDKAPTVGVAFGWNTLDTFGRTFNDEYVSILAPAAPGKTVTWEPDTPDMYIGAAVKKDSPYKEQVFKIIDKWLEPDMAIQSYYGDFDKYVIKNGKDDYTVKPEAMDAADMQWGLNNHGLSVFPKDLKFTGVADVERTNRDWAIYKQVQPSLDSDDYMPVYVSPDDNDQNTLTNNNLAIFNFAMPKIAGWMRNGGLDDAQWEEFKTQLDTLKLNENVKIWQKWYDEYTK